MNSFSQQIITLLKSLPLSRKISLGFTIILIISGFAFMFLWANQVEYQVLFTNLTPEDAGSVLEKIKEKNVPHKLGSGGTTVLVAKEHVHELRLLLAGDGLPKGGNIGFEVFDKTDFRTTKFVQELNYRRALQGELARTINRFEEVNDSRVFIVLPKESLFIEESKPASASIQLDLRTSLPAGKVAAIIHLAASAVEGLDPNQVTVVDTKGRVLFKGGSNDDGAALLNHVQLDYKGKIEDEIRMNVQSMLEGIVGENNAIVRVSADVDFSETVLEEEEYDPSATAVRSNRNIEQSLKTSQGGVEDTEASVTQKRAGVVPPPTSAGKTETRKELATNYEINKVTRATTRPAGSIRRLSVAAVINGTTKTEKQDDGTLKQIYIPRTEGELSTFEEMVKGAMGYSEDREDSVSVTSIAFSESFSMDQWPEAGQNPSGIFNLLASHKQIIFNIFLVFMVFLLVVRPLLKGMKGMSTEPAAERMELPSPDGTTSHISEIKEPNQREQILQLARNNPDRTEQLIKGWIGD